MKKITGIIIAKNSEKLIESCLDSLAFCDEVLVIDGGSTDNTIGIAKKKNARVISHISDDFAEIRNFSKEKAESEWILYIDDDERVTEELAEKISAAVKNPEEFVAFSVLRKNFYFGNHEWPKIETHVRLFKKSHLLSWYGKLHESPKIDGAVGELDGFLLHHTHRNLSEMVVKTMQWSKIEAEMRLQAGHPRMTWWRFPRVMTSAFVDSYIKQGGWRVGGVGLIESMYQAFSIFITYARLWELQQKKK